MDRNSKSREKTFSPFRHITCHYILHTNKGSVETPKFLMQHLVIFLLVILLVTPLHVFAESPLTDCVDQFIEGKLENAPTIGGSSPDAPFNSNRHLCYRDDGVSFYALEYWAEEFAPRWAAYKLHPINYGKGGCATYTRDKGNCYIKSDTWEEFQDCTSANDPFHRDHILTDDKLGISAFENTGHDRGHIAPRQAFSWHVCGAYQTFTMANMSPQRAYFNQGLWMHLEKQVLTWAIDEGPIYVVSGTIYNEFPHQEFEIYRSGKLDSSQTYTPGNTMLSIVRQHQKNYKDNESGEILKPKRGANPYKVMAKVRELRMPTGYYKVIYRPPRENEPAHSIGFLIPHTFQNLNKVRKGDVTNVFWNFVARIDVIEAASDTKFQGIPTSMKRNLGDRFFSSKKTGRDIRSACQSTVTPKGVVTDTTKRQRIAMCIDQITDISK